MYVCVCNAIRDKDLRAAALLCAGDAEAVYAMLGFAPKCRQCLADAQVMVEEARKAELLPVCLPD